MNKSKITLIVLGFVLAFTSIFPSVVSASENITYFYNNVYGLTNFKRNASSINIIAPQVYTVGYDLKVKKPTSANTKILREAKSKHVPIMPLIVNADFSKILMSDILLSSGAQDEIIKYMISEADKYKFIGWQFDFENINHLDRDMYSAFVAKTYTELKKHDLQFSVAVIPRNKPYDVNSTNQDWSSAYDFNKIGQNTDFISLMSYDDPYSLGPVASIPFTKKILNYMITQVPAQKLSLGIPLYCWKWNTDTNTRVGSLTHKLAAKEYLKGKDKDKEYDEALGNEKITYSRDDINYAVWCESEESLETKMGLVKSYGLRGTSAWAIGQEPTWWWRELKKY